MTSAAAAVVPSAAPTHPLNRSWTLWYDSPSTYNKDDWELSLVPIMTVTTVEDFFAMMTLMKSPHALRASCQYHFFQTGVKPMWEDPANRQGGKLWVNLDPAEKLRIKRGDSSKDSAGSEETELDRVWSNALMALVGEQLEPSATQEDSAITGVVLSKRKQYNRVALWLKDASNTGAIEAVKKAAPQELGLSGSASLSFSRHDEKN